MGSNTSRLIRDSIDRHIRLQTCRDLVDYGSVSPNGLYLSASANHDLDVVRELIVSRKLSPFYTGLADAPAGSQSSLSMSSTSSDRSMTRSRSASSIQPRDPPTIMHNTYAAADQRGGRIPEEMLYNDAVECPICFLYYPPNINYSRCCNKPICTECFLALRMLAERTVYTCPFCNQDKFGVVYSPPSWLQQPPGKKATSAAQETTRPRPEAIPDTDPRVVLCAYVMPTLDRRKARDARLRSNGSRLFTTRRRGRTASETSIRQSYRRRAAQMGLDLDQLLQYEAIRSAMVEQDEEAARRRQQQEDDDNQPLYRTAQCLGYQQQQTTTAASDIGPIYRTAQCLGYQQQQTTTAASDIGPISRPESLYDYDVDDEDILQSSDEESSQR